MAQVKKMKKKIRTKPKPLINRREAKTLVEGYTKPVSYDVDAIMFFKDVLTRALSDRDFCIKVTQTKMRPEHMPRPFMRWVYDKLKRFLDNPKYGSKLPSVRVYKDLLEKDTKLDPKLKVAYFEKVKDLFERKVQNEEYALEVVQKMVQKQEFKLLLEATISKLGQYTDPEVAIKSLVNKSFDISGDNSIQIIDLIDEHKKRQEFRQHVRDNPKKYKRFKFGVPSIDKCLPGGLRQPMIAGVAAKTGVGKSITTIGVGFGGITQELNVTHVTSENENEQTTGRYDSHITHLKYDDIQLASLKEEEQKSFDDKYKHLRKKYKARIKIVKLQPNEFTAATILHSLNILESQGHVTQLLIVDSPDLMQTINPNVKDERLRHKAIYWELKVLGENKKLITFVTAQLNKMSSDDNPSAGDMSESYDKARMLDFLMVMSQSKTMKAVNEAALFIVKNRDGRTPAEPIMISTEFERMRFEEKPPEADPPSKDDKAGKPGLKVIEGGKKNPAMDNLRSVGTKKIDPKKLQGVSPIKKKIAPKPQADTGTKKKVKKVAKKEE